MPVDRKAHPMRVQPFVNDHDFLVGFIGSLGYSRNLIQAKTGLTNCQVGYRLSKEQVRLSDYRSGRSPIARMVLSAILGDGDISAVRTQFTKHLEKQDIWDNENEHAATKAGVRTIAGHRKRRKPA